MNEEQKIKIQTAIQSGTLNLETEIEYLVQQGCSKEQATTEVLEQVELYKEYLFKQALDSQNREDVQKLALTTIAIMALIGPIVDITSMYWYAFTLIVGAILGYIAYKDKPIAGIVGSICFTLTLPFFYILYVSGRTSIITIELLIPMGISMGISYGLGWLIFKGLYSKE